MNILSALQQKAEAQKATDALAKSKKVQPLLNTPKKHLTNNPQPSASEVSLKEVPVPTQTDLKFDKYKQQLDHLSTLLNLPLTDILFTAIDLLHSKLTKN